jgi:hypothetical protein
MADEVVATDDVEPYRIQMNFSFAHNDVATMEAIFDAVVDEAQHRGLIFEWGFAKEMDLDDVIPGSPLAHLLAGTEPER